MGIWGVVLFSVLKEGEIISCFVCPGEWPEGEGQVSLAGEGRESFGSDVLE